MVAEAVQAELHKKGHRALLFFPDAGVETPEKDRYYSRPDLYHIWRFPVAREGLRLETFPLIIPDPNPRSGTHSVTFRDLSDDLLNFYFEEARTQLRRLIKTFHPDIIESMHVWALGSLLRDLGAPYIVTAHHSDQMGYRYDERMRSYADRAAAGARYVFCISEFVRRDVIGLYPGVDPQKTVVLENGYDQATFRPQAADRAEVMRELGVPDDPTLPVISFAGKISRTKGVDVLLRANRRVQQERKALLIIAGAGRLEDEFDDAEIRDFHSENVHLTGHHPQAVIAQLHSIAAVSVIPSRTEGFGLAGLEAMGCGTPLVATRSGGPETFAVGAIVPPEDPDALAGGLLSVLGQRPEAAEEMSRSASERARGYSWERMARLRLEYYRRALDG